jgi:serine phosphatase RsbU (regulator of sigma subunit)
MSLKQQFTIVTLFFTLVVMALSTYINVESQKSVLKEETDIRISLIKENLYLNAKSTIESLKSDIENDIASFNFSNIPLLLEQVIEHSEDINNIALFNMDKTLSMFDGDEKLMKLLSELKSIEKFNIKEVNKDIFIVSMPITILEQWGNVHVVYSLNKINSEILKTEETIKRKTEEIIKEAIFISLIIAIILIFITYFLMNKFISPIVLLTKTAEKISNGNLELNKELLNINSNDEIGKLSYAFSDMSIKLSVSYNELKELNENLEQKVETRTKELQKSKDIVEIAHKNIQDNINYASIIQHAILPETSVLEKYFPEHFIFWLPKDTVGGDIYFMTELDSKDEILIMVLDGAGHGVSGSFVTMLVKAIESQIIAKINNGKLEPSPAKILQQFNINLKTMLKQEKGSKSNAGFDGGVLYYKKSTNECRFAGAKSDLVTIHNGNLNIVKSDRKNVGFPRIKIDQEYKEHLIEAKSGMSFYLFTDGIVDQEGDEGKKYGKTRLHSLLLENNIFKEQSIKVKNSFLNFKAKNSQSDDVTIIGLKTP